ncbi:error-prone DNA polymerase [Chitinimonas sp. BJYL2]|uniref:error-prone DNA polymerase n=1 Tax=Chitinimonas sp. BJYL2 TaxID=2976696 RepID=UPI0022B58273|nr:error-prone DNA polymerase [Chitinimonas sp. BJYL2]
MLPDYAELHCLSNFSFQRGASHASELVARAQALGYRALAITDECSLAGIVRAHVAAKEAGLALIVGSEFHLDDGLHLVLLAPDREAYGDLCELITLGRRRAHKGSYALARADVAALSANLLALWVPPSQPGSQDMADAHWLGQQFGDRAWLAVSLLQEGDDRQKLARLQALAAQAGLPCVATGDVHMHVRSRRALQDMLVAVRSGKPVAECGYALFPNGERHLRSRLTLGQLYPSEMLAETLRIADRCHFDLDSLRYEYPEELVPDGTTPDSHLRALAEAGLQRRFPLGVSTAVRTQLEHELSVIAELHYAAFFLTVEDVVRFARSQDILCQGRGSAANSVVCYALGITEVRPEGEASMLFERFISVERNEPPDIDVDFEHQRREIVIQYLYAKYGRDRAALAATVISYRSRSALRDVARALGFDEEQLDRLGNTLAWWDKPADLPQRLQEAGFDPASRTVQWLILLTGTLRGFPRHLSQHVGGFVFSRGPLHRLVPIENAGMKDRTVIQWDKDDLEAMRLLKVDVLALGMLTALKRTLDMVTQLRGQPMTLADIPRDDAATYDMICRADTVGVFQIESRAQMAMLPRLKPRGFYDLVVEVAIVRPGPIQGDMVHPYLRRRNGQEAIDYPEGGIDADKVKAVLQRTYGVPIFQEQVMQLAVYAAGFTPGKADQLRRAMGAWQRSGKMGTFHDELFDGMAKRGYAPEFAERIWKQIEGFSEYGFPESHSASFALLAYASSWLKCHEPAAFTCALLNSQPMGFYAPNQLIQDAARHGIVFLPVDVQHSHWDCRLEGESRPVAGHSRAQPAVRLGLRMVRGLAQAVGERIAEVRGAGSYAGPQDLQRRAALDSRALGLLADADALACFGGTRRQARWQVGGLSTVRDLADVQDVATPLPALPQARIGEEIRHDYQRLGLSLRGHPLALLRERLRHERYLSAAELAQSPDRKGVWVCGMVVGRQRPGTASGVVFVTLEDETGNVNVVMWNRIVERQRTILLGARLMAVFGMVQQQDGVLHLIARRLVDRSDWLGSLSVQSRDFH